MLPEGREELDQAVLQTAQSVQPPPFLYFEDGVPNMVCSFHPQLYDKLAKIIRVTIVTSQYSGPQHILR